MYSTSDFRNGLKILLENTPYEITYFQHVKPGKGGAFVRTKLRNLYNNSIVEKTFRTSEKVGVPDISNVDLQFLYSDDDYHFMNTATYEQIAVSKKALGEKANFITEGLVAMGLILDGEVISIDLPPFVVLQIAQCDPGVRGDTVSGASKPATLETGAKVNVPLFVNEGEHIKVDTRTSQYIERSEAK